MTNTGSAGSFIYQGIPRLLADQGGVWSPGSTDGGPLANAYDHSTTAPSVRISDSYAISSTILNVATVTFNRYRNPSIAASQSGNLPPVALGLGAFETGNFPIIKFQGVDGNQFRSAVKTGLPFMKARLAASSTTSMQRTHLSTATISRGRGDVTR